MRQPSTDEPALIARIVALATRFGRYGSRRITAVRRQEGWRVNHKRVERRGRQEGLRVPAKQPKRGRLWLADGALMRRRAERPHPGWSYDVVFDRTADGRPLRLLAIVDADTRECRSRDVARRRRSDDVLARLAPRFVERGPPTSLRSDNGPACTATAVRDWLTRVGVTTLFIEPGSPWENGSGESFNGTRRDACLNRERVDTLLEAQGLIAGWRREDNPSRPHSALGYRPPAPETLEIQPPHPAYWADRRVPALTERLVQRSGAGQCLDADRDHMNEQRSAPLFSFSVPPTRDTNVLSVTLHAGDMLFVVGANGTGKSSLMHRLYRDNFEAAVRITAHRRTWLSSSVVDVTAHQKQQNESQMRNAERDPQYRWRADYDEQRPGMSIFNLIDAENSPARKIADAMRRHDEEDARKLAQSESPLEQINLTCPRSLYQCLS